MEDMMVSGFERLDGRIDVHAERIDVLELRFNDIDVRHRGAAVDGDLPGVIYAEYGDGTWNAPSNRDSYGLGGIDLFAKAAVDDLMTDATEEGATDDAEEGAGQRETEGEKPTGEDTVDEEPEPELAEKVATKQGGMTDVFQEDDPEEEIGNETGFEEPLEQEIAEKQTGSQVPETEVKGKGGGDTPHKEKKKKEKKPSYSDLIKPPFGPKNLRTSNV